MTQVRTIEDRIRKPSSKLSKLAFCIYGKGGVGKTSLLRYMPGKGLVIDIPQYEGGTMVLSDCADRIDVLPIVKWDELEDVLQLLKENKQGYQWYAFDTITAIQELAKRKTLKERTLAADPHMLDQRDYGKVGLLIGDFIPKFRSLSLHGIFLAQERLRGTGEDGTLEYQPDLTPSSFAGVNPSMSLTGRLYIKEVEDGDTHEMMWERHLRVGPHQTTVTKARAVPGRDLPLVIREPKLGEIFAYLMGLEGAKRPEAAKADVAITFELV